MTLKWLLKQNWHYVHILILSQMFFSTFFSFKLAQIVFYSFLFRSVVGWGKSCIYILHFSRIFRLLRDCEFLSKHPRPLYLNPTFVLFLHFSQSLLKVCLIFFFLLKSVFYLCSVVLPILPKFA